MKRNGFVFVETIIAIVVLTSSLLLLYSSFNKVLQSEKTRVNYDDVNYIYRSWYIKESISNLNMMSILSDLTNNRDKYFVTLGIEYQDLFKGYEKEENYISNLLKDFEVNQIILMKENKIDNIKECTLECSLDSNCDDYINCNTVYTNLSDGMINYLKTIYIDIPCTYVMAIEYITCNKDNTNCRNYYSWVSV